MNQEVILNKLSNVLNDTDRGIYQHGTFSCVINSLSAERGVLDWSHAIFAMRLMHCGYQVFMVGGVVTPSLGKDDLLLLISGSGSTETLLPLAKKAKAINAKVVLISMKHQSAIGDIGGYGFTNWKS